MHATCSIHMQRQLVGLTVIDPNFQLIGIQHAARGAKMYVIQETFLYLARRGVLSMVHDRGLWPKSLLGEEDIVAGLPKVSSKCAAPSAFN